MARLLRIRHVDCGAKGGSLRSSAAMKSTKAQYDRNEVLSGLWYATAQFQNQPENFMGYILVAGARNHLYRTRLITL